MPVSATGEMYDESISPGANDRRRGSVPAFDAAFRSSGSAAVTPSFQTCVFHTHTGRYEEAQRERNAADRVKDGLQSSCR